MPSCIYTVPALATVGLTEAQAKDQNPEVKVTTNDMTGCFSGKSYSESVAWAKVIVDEKEDRIVGAHLVGHHAEELIHLFALAMRHEIAASELKNDIFAFPTFSSDMKNMF